jgi:hypothetical protein
VSLTYSTLQTAVLTISKRPTLTTEVVECIRRCEGRLRRELIAYELQATLAEVDRSSGGIYTAPAYCLQVQDIFTTDALSRSYPLENVGRVNIRGLVATAPVLHFAHYQSVIEFRGVPATDQEMTVNYFGHPAPLATTDTNALLDDHEGLYIAGALFELYSDYTEDLELAQAQLDKFNHDIDELNKAIGRKLGGGVTAAAYNFGNVKMSGGY